MRSFAFAALAALVAFATPADARADEAPNEASATTTTDHRWRLNVGGGLMMGRPMASHLRAGGWGRIVRWFSVGADGGYLHHWSTCERGPCPDATTVVTASVTPRFHVVLDDGLELTVGPTVGLGIGTWGNDYPDPGSHLGFVWGIATGFGIYLTPWFSIDPTIDVVSAPGDVYPDNKSRLLFGFGAGLSVHFL